MKIKLFCLFILFVFCKLHAQDQVYIGINASEKNVKCINLASKGIILLDKSDDDVLKIKKIDTTLTLNWELSVNLEAKSSFIDHYFDGSYLYLLFETKKAYNYELIKIASTIAAIQRMDIPTVPNFQINKFIANYNTVVIAGKVKKEPFLIFYDTENASSKYISTNLEGVNQIESLLTDINENVNVVFLNSIKRKNQLIFRTYTPKGLVLDTKVILAGDDQVFLSSSIIDLEGSKLLIGDYGRSQVYNDAKQNSQGIYIYNVGEKLKPTFYAFNAFNSFFNFLSEKEKARMNNQISRRKAKGKSYYFDYRINFNKLKKIDNQIFLSGEIFQPEFRTTNNFMPSNSIPYNYTSIYGRSFFFNPFYANNNSIYRNTSNTQYFDGYRYLSGFLMSIKTDGSLMWDNSFPYKNIRSMNLKNILNVNFEAKNHFLSYNNGQKIIMAEYENSGKEITKAELGKETYPNLYKSKKYNTENFEHWFGNYFINWDVIKRPDAKLNIKQVCLIQKIPIKL